MIVSAFSINYVRVNNLLSNFTLFYKTKVLYRKKCPYTLFK